MFRGDQLAAVFRGVPFRLPVQLGHVFGRPQICRRVAVTLQAEAHVQRLGLLHLGHLIDSPVTAYATYSRRKMRLVVEVHIVGKAMDLDPRYRLSARITLADLLQPRAVGPDFRVAVHAGRGGGNSRERRFGHSGVAVVTVDT